MKIPIKHAIDSGAWFQCETNEWSGDEPIRFNIRVISFTKINLNDIDEPQKIKLDDGVLWLLKIEVVNLAKKELVNCIMTWRIEIHDHDDFVFKATKDPYLGSDTKYAQAVGLRRFADWSSIPNLQPKIKIAGALAYLLPDEDTADYYLSVEGGNIREV